MWELGLVCQTSGRSPWRVEEGNAKDTWMIG
jgi:hypothetical protein